MWEAGYEAYSKIMLKSGKAGRSLKTASKVKIAQQEKWKAMLQAAPDWEGWGWVMLTRNGVRA